MRMRPLALAGVSFAFLAAIACRPKHDPTSPTPGSIIVIVTAPAGMTPDIEITGPGGFAQTVTATSTILLAPGTYTVAALRVDVPGDHVTTIYDATPSTPTTIDLAPDGQEMISVTYARRPGSGRIWAATTTALGGYDIGAMTGNSVVIMGTNLQLNGITADAAGGLWVSALPHAILHFAPAELATSRTLSFVSAIETSSASFAPRSLAFDANGTLWAADPAGNRIVGFTASQLAAGGAVAPAHSLVSPDFSFARDLAFDASGNLWVDAFAEDAVARFSAAKLAAGGSQSADVVVHDSAGVLSFPRALAVDTANNLWVFTGGGTIAKYDPSLTAATGAPSPSFLFKPVFIQSSLAMAFDASGSLWVADPVEAMFFLPADLASTAAGVAPSASLSTPAMHDFAFDPAP